MHKENKYEISIIVPVYNVETYLNRCIDSILNQSFTNFELILVDDGSTDNSSIICDEYTKKDKRVKVIHKKNGGLSSARNAGLDIAQGKYIGFVDSDDFIDKNMYSILYKDIQNNNSDIAICDYEEVYESEEFRNIKKNDNKLLVLTNLEALGKIYEKKGWKYVVAWNKLYNRHIFADIRFPIGKIHEDEMVAHEILYKTNRVTFNNKKMYYYLQRNDSIMGIGLNIKSLDNLEAMKNRTDFFKNKNLKDLQLKAEYEYLKVFIKLYFMFIDKDEASIIRLKQIKRDFNSILFRLLKNSNYNFKEKISIFILYINPKIYRKLFLS